MLKNRSLKESEQFFVGSVSDYDYIDLDYPFVHRICDFKLKDQTYRLLRKVINNTEKLKKWLLDEEDEDLNTDDSTPWKNT